MILTADTLRTLYLNGLVLADPLGRPLPDAVIDAKIRSVTAAFQRRYSIRLEPTVVRLGHDTLPGAGLAPDLPRVTLDALPWDPQGWEGNQFVSLDLPVGPVRAEPRPRVLLKLPGMGQPVEWTKDWVQVSPRSRVIQLYPMGPTINLLQLNATGIGLMAMGGARAIPTAWQVEYVAGYTEEDLAGDDADVLNAVGKLAAVAILVPGSIDRFAAQGIAGLSASVDGLSNSTQLAGGGQALRYQPLIQAYQEELKAWETMFKSRYGGPSLFKL